MPETITFKFSMSSYGARTWATTRRMQRDAGKGRGPGRVPVDWRTCDAEGSGCTGVQVGSYGRCWAHLSPGELRQALGSLAPGEDLDLRGTTLDSQLLGRILSAFREPSSRKLLVGNASLENASIDSDTPFANAVFDGSVRCFEARFGGKADFYGAEFKAYAGFNGAEFDYADFEKAKFAGSTSFKYVKFRGPAEFAHVRFVGLTEFVGAEFLDNAYFQSVQIADEARF